jgi:hypothetical protein
MVINASNFIIETERLYLRLITPDDYPDLMRMHNKKIIILLMELNRSSTNKKISFRPILVSFKLY